MAKIAAPPLRVENAVEPHARQHRPSWFGALRQHAYGRAAPERIAGKVIVGEAEMADEVEGVVGEDVRLVAGRIMRLVAVAVTAKVRHDHPKTRVGKDRKRTRLNSSH